MPLNIPIRQYWELLANYLRPLRTRVALLTALLFGSIGLQLANPLLLRRFIDGAATGAAPRALIGTALLFFGVALVQQVASVLASYVGGDVGWRATNRLRYDLAGHCMRLDMGFHNARTPGEMIERIDGDVNALSNFFSQFVIYVLGNILLLIGVLLLLFRVDWRVGLTLSAFVLVTTLLLMRLRNVAVPHWAASREADAALYGYLEERLAGTQDIRANGANAHVMRRFYDLMGAAYRRTLKAGLMASVMVNATWVLFSIGTAAAFVVGAYLYRQRAISIGTVYLIFYYTTLLTRPIEHITQQLDDLQRASAGIARVRELMQLRSRIADGPGAAFPPGPLAVELDGVSFAYDGENPVLHDLTLRLQPGTVLGLLGRTGSGKTTTTRLLTRLYDPQGGAIRLGDGERMFDIRDAHLADLGRHVGMVTQNVQLFNATVRDNLTLFDREIADERILRVIEDLGLWGWYSSLTDGLDTTLSSDGGGLSAGEAQLLAFTRIFLRNPGLVILDEASSRLDPATEQLIERAVGRLVQGRTAIIIAHRLATVERVDEIVVLEEGRILEHGPRDQLAADSTSRFHQLLRSGLEEVLA